MDYTRHIENHNSIRLAHCITQRTFTRIIQVSHVVNLAITTTNSITTKSFCTWKS